MSNVISRYLDKRAAAINAVKDYPSMVFIIASTDELIARRREEMIDIRSPSVTDDPKVEGHVSRTEKLNAALEDIDVLKERYQSAKQFLEWYEPCWNELSDDEQYILSEFYQQHDDESVAAIYRICAELGIEKSTAYNKKNAAVQHLSLLLYGK